MTFKSLLLAATMAGGIAFGASAANAQVEKYTVTGSDSAYTGTFEANLTPLSISTSSNYFYDAFDGTGAYSGINEVSFSPLSQSLVLLDDSTPLAYVVDTGTSPSTVLSLPSFSSTGDVITASAAPEPGVWALLIAGVAMIGSALRVSRKQGALSVA